MNPKLLKYDTYDDYLKLGFNPDSDLFINAWLVSLHRDIPELLGKYLVQRFYSDNQLIHIHVNIYCGNGDGEIGKILNHLTNYQQPSIDNLKFHQLNND